MSPKETAVLIIGSLGVLLAAVRFPKRWRGQAREQAEDPPAWWAFGNSAWRALSRTDMPALLFLTAALAFYALEASASSERGAATTVTQLVLGVLAGAGMVLWLSIVLYNRPRALVPPDLRNEPGLLEQPENDRGRH